MGQEIEIGDAKLKLTRPIDRCKATSIDLESGKDDCNLPAFLTRQYGHHFCGIYAQVTSAGAVQTDCGIYSSTTPVADVPQAAIAQETAPATHQWPRPATIEKIVDETPDTKSFWIQSDLLGLNKAINYRPGQHLLVHGLGVEKTYRAYTISAAKQGALRVTVRRQQGAGSNAMHDLVAGQTICVSGPKGNLAIDRSAKKVIFATAGIGIRPATALLPTLERTNHVVDFHHTAPTRKLAALWHEVIAFSKIRDHANATLHLTKEVPKTPNQKQGRPNFAALFATCDPLQTQLIICGPGQFVADVKRAASQAGFDNDMIHAEAFATPNVEPLELKPAHPGPSIVRFDKSNHSIPWTEKDGTLLDFAEKNGLVLPAHCRAGICNTCETRVISGSAQTSDDAVSNKSVLCCSAFPSSDLVLDA